MSDWGAVKARLQRAIFEWSYANANNNVLPDDQVPLDCDTVAADIRAALERVEELEQTAARIASEAACERLRAEAAEAKLARCMEALSAYVSQDAAFAEDHSLCGDCEWALRYSRARAELARLEGLYSALLLAVAQKYPGETRHETALRYIVERERRASESGEAKEHRIRAAKEK